MTGPCQWTFELPDFGFPSDIRGVRSEPVHSAATVSAASEQRRHKKNLGLHSLGRAQTQARVVGGENVPEIALLFHSLLALGPFHTYDAERTACQLVILIHGTHTITELLKFNTASETLSLNNSCALTNRGLHLCNVGARGLRAEPSGSAPF